MTSTASKPPIGARLAADAAGRVSEGGSQGKAGAVRESLVIVGNGMVGHKLCERLVEDGAVTRFHMTVFGEEPRPAYDRVHLTRVLGGSPAEALQLASRGWYEEQDIDLVTGDAVVSVDREKRVVVSASGREVAYDRLVFATGSRAFLPPIPGHDLPGVFVYRTVDDLDRIRRHASRSRRAAVLGGGLLGLEAAKALADLGLATWVVERGSGLMARQLDPEASRLLRGHVEKLGLHTITGREAERIEALGDDRLLQFNTGECLRVQLVVVAAGIRPRDELAAACGLKLGPRGGVEVDDSLRTSDPAVYAVGECAVHRGTIYGLAGPGFRMAEALAANLAGRRRRFTGADQSTWLKLAGTSVATLGDYQTEGESLVATSNGGYRRLVLDRNRLVGAIAIGEWPEQARVHEAVENRRRLWRWQRSRFLRHGRIGSDAAPRPVAEWPETAIVCNCMGVRRGALSAACAQGCATVEQLARTTGASTVCGSCRPLLAQLLGGPAVIRALPGVRWLLLASGLTLVAALVVLTARPVAFSGTVQGGWKPEALWRSDLPRQVTGFILLGLALFSLLLSARKRLRRFKLGEVGSWRAMHGVLGALTVVALITHTGLRLGQNLNFVLMADFLALALLGAFAGGVTALEHRLAGPAARRLRSVWTGAHIALTWPLPVLVGFHILTAYYF